MLVMSRTFLRDRVRTSEIRDAIMEIARRSDQIEQQLTQLDQYRGGAGFRRPGQSGFRVDDRSPRS
jgi:hypothetical protein